MISLTRFRELLGDSAADLAPSELEMLREQLYRVANSVCDLYLTGHNAVVDEDRILSQLEPDTLADIEERAAVLEFDGNMTRDQATRLALNLELGSTLKRAKPS